MSLDPYLSHAFEAERERRATASAFESFRGALEPPAERLPVLIRLKDPTRPPAESDELKIDARLGDLVVATATEAALRRLEGDPNVIDIEASRPSAGLERASIPFVRADRVHADAWAEKGGNVPSA